MTGRATGVSCRLYWEVQMSRSSLDQNRLNHDEQKERNKARARKMVLVMGIACIVFILAMMVEVYL